METNSNSASQKVQH